jgi:hypothetical protein
MPRPSKIDRLPPEVKTAIAQLRERGHTIDEILAHLGKLAPAAQISRSGLGRHVQELEKVAEKIRASREISEALVKQFGDAPENKTARLNIELMHSAVLKLAAQDGDVTFDPKEVLFLSDALAKLAAAQKLDTDNTLRIRKEVMKQAEAAVDKVAKEEGLSADAVAKLKSRFLGIRDNAAAG